ncbi:hypothetical protein [Streptomyces sp. NPDC050121]|uniref:hypothetical protein n=1 Tax=Streptomyces sp. NPDC050121 TaxID=3365601 RepID=UPI00378B53D7
MDNNGRDAIRIHFATATCAPCPVRDQCTRSTQYGRQLTVRAPPPGTSSPTPRSSPSTRTHADCRASRSPRTPGTSRCTARSSPTRASARCCCSTARPRRRP